MCVSGNITCHAGVFAENKEQQTPPFSVNHVTKYANTTKCPWFEVYNCRFTNDRLFSMTWQKCCLIIVKTTHRYIRHSWGPLSHADEQMASSTVRKIIIHIYLGCNDTTEEEESGYNEVYLKTPFRNLLLLSWHLLHYITPPGIWCPNNEDDKSFIANSLGGDFGGHIAATLCHLMWSWCYKIW